MTEIRYRKPKFSEKRNDVILVQDRVSRTSKYSLRPALGCRRITPYSKNIQPLPQRSVAINFGGGALPGIFKLSADAGKHVIVLNSPDKVAISANKLRTFELLKAANVPTVRWTVQPDEARQWLAKGHKTLARLSLSSSSGRGISVASSVDGSDLKQAPLYTRYFPKTHEFRVHVVDGQAIDLTEKKLKEEFRGDRTQRSVVRSFDNGWVHAHDGLSLTNSDDLDSLRRLGVEAIKAVGLDFGAVDVLACLDDAEPRRLSRAVVCEVNSAPGIENEATKQAYVRAFNALINKRKSA